MNDESRVKLWDAINQYATACGADVKRIGALRQHAVVLVEEAVADIETTARCGHFFDTRGKDASAADFDGHDYANDPELQPKDYPHAIAQLRADNAELTRKVDDINTMLEDYAFDPAKSCAIRARLADSPEAAYFDKMLADYAFALGTCQKAQAFMEPAGEVMQCASELPGKLFSDVAWFETAFGGMVMHLLINQWTAFLAANGAKNYVEFKFSSGGRTMTLNLGAHEGKTPDELRVAAEAEVKRLRGVVYAIGMSSGFTEWEKAGEDISAAADLIAHVLENLKGPAFITRMKVRDEELAAVTKRMERAEEFASDVIYRLPLADLDAGAHIGSTRQRTMASLIRAYQADRAALEPV